MQGEFFFCQATPQEQFSALPRTSAILHISERAIPGAPVSPVGSPFPFHFHQQDLSSLHAALPTLGQCPATQAQLPWGSQAVPTATCS